MKRNSHIWFNQKLLKLQMHLTPMKIKCNYLSTRTKKTVVNEYKNWLKEEFKKWYHPRNNLLISKTNLHQHEPYTRFRLIWLDPQVRKETNIIARTQHLRHMHIISQLSKGGKINTHKQVYSDHYILSYLINLSKQLLPINTTKKRF